MATNDKKDHPVGESIGAASGAIGGLAAGAAIGGPAGAVVGAAVGAVAGGAAGHGVAASVDTAEEDAYWRDNYASRPYVAHGAPYGDYRDAYRYGWESRARAADATWDTAEPELARGWRSESGMTWDRAKGAVQDAWHRVERAVPGDADRDGR